MRLLQVLLVLFLLLSAEELLATRYCPNCPRLFLLENKNIYYCSNCSYTEKKSDSCDVQLPNNDLSVSRVAGSHAVMTTGAALAPGLMTTHIPASAASSRGGACKKKPRKPVPLDPIPEQLEAQKPLPEQAQEYELDSFLLQSLSPIALAGTQASSQGENPYDTLIQVLGIIMDSDLKYKVEITKEKHEAFLKEVLEIAKSHPGGMAIEDFLRWQGFGEVSLGTALCQRQGHFIVHINGLLIPVVVGRHSVYLYVFRQGAMVIEIKKIRKSRFYKSIEKDINIYSRSQLR